MTTPPSALARHRAVSPSAERASTAGLLAAATKLGRVAAIVAVGALLISMRTQAGVTTNLALTATAAGALWLVLGRDASARPAVVYVIGFGIFAQLRALADETGLPVHYAYAIDSEEALFGGLPSAWLQEHLYQAGRLGPIDVAATGVYLSYFVAVHAVALAIWLRARQQFVLYAGAVLLTLYVGLVACTLVPTAPPWLAAEDGLTPPVSRVFQDVSSSNAPGSYDTGATVAGINEVAAMPSLHTAITVLIAIFAFRFDRRLGLVAAFYACAMGFTLVYFGEHYVVDVLAGAVTAGICWQIALGLWRRLLADADRGASDTNLRDLSAAA